MPAPRRRLRLLAVLTALTLLGAACGDDDDSGSDPTIEDTGGDDSAGDDGSTEGVATDDGGESEPVDACSLITTAELEEIVGSPYSEGSPAADADTGSSRCTWTNTDASPVRQITVVVDTTDSIQRGLLGQALGDAEEYYEAQKANLTVDEELDIGDEAFRVGSNVVVLDGDTLYNVLTPDGTEDAVAAVTAVAEAIVD
jgi:hypothetical protein